MRIVVLDVLYMLYNVREGLEDDDVDVDEEMVSLVMIGVCLVDWMDLRKCYYLGKEEGVEGERKNVNVDVYLEFVRGILERLFGSVLSKFDLFFFYVWLCGEC